MPLQILRFGCFIIGLFAFHFSSATQIIDQQQTLNGSLGASVSSTFGGYSQSFIQAGSNISGAGFFLNSTGQSGSGEFVIGLFTFAPVNLTSIPFFTSGTVTGVEGTWVDAFWSPIALTSGQTYWIDIRTTAGSFEVGQQNSNNGGAYGSGSAYYNGMVTGNWDMTFRTYTDVTFPGENNVPDTGTTALLALVAIAMLTSFRKISVA